MKCAVAKHGDWSTVDRGIGIDIETIDGRHVREIVPYSKGLLVVPAEHRIKIAV